MHSGSARSYPSPATILAAAAFALALGGTAIAAPGMTAGKITRSKVKSIADQRIAEAAPSLSVASAARATSADTAATANNANTAASAATAADAEALNGLRANQLVRATSKTSVGGLAFDEPNFTDVLSRTVSAPTAGIFVISAQMNVNRSVDSTDPTLIAGRAALDGAAATVQTHQRSTEDGTFGEAVAVTGAVPVAAGTHTASLQAAELSSGAAFLSNLALTVQFFPFGDAGLPGVLSKRGGASANE